MFGMNIENVIGVAATTMGLIVACIGLPIQIIKNYKNKSTNGLSFSLWTLGLINGSLWLSYGFIKPRIDWFIVTSNIPGVFFTCVMLLQFYLYRSANIPARIIDLHPKHKTGLRRILSKLYIFYYKQKRKLFRKRLIIQNRYKFEMAQKMSLKKQYLRGKSICKTTFIVPKSAANNANCVQIVGDFTDWQQAPIPMKKLKNGSFTATLNLKSGREYQYRYLIDNAYWENDWSADKYSPSPYPGTENSVIVA